ncbi:MAG: aminoacetone oxidase family FAD-binding enzyme [candidate division WOR-3 bacterium]
MSLTGSPARVLVVGGGAAGLACAVAAARLGLRVVVLEKTDRCGHKLALTGGRKGNYTHAEAPRAMAGRFGCDVATILPLLRRFPYQRIVEFFSSVGIRPRVDPDGCVWPERSDAVGLRDALLAAVRRSRGEVMTRCRVIGLEPGWRVKLAGGEELPAAAVCLATGGASFPQTGSTGDGLRLAAELGIRTAPWHAALASLKTSLDLTGLSGITQPRVRMTLLEDGREVKTAEGHFIFAHGYVSGSSVLNLSGRAAPGLAGGRRVALRIDWMPDRSPDELRQEFAELRRTRPRAQLTTVATAFVARKLALKLAQLAGVRSDTTMAFLSREDEQRFRNTLKETELEIVGTEPLERATVTGGGISLDEVNLETMEARRFPGLYFAGEVLDVWAETGGYNLHFAWATGIAVAEAIAGRELA